MFGTPTNWDFIVTAQPYMNRGKQLRDIKGKYGAPFGETIMQKCHLGNINGGTGRIV